MKINRNNEKKKLNVDAIGQIDNCMYSTYIILYKKNLIC